MISKLDEAHIDLILLTHHVGRLACCWEDKPYVVPITYVFHEGSIYGHTNDGEKVRIMRQNPHVCLEVDEIQDTGRWRCVVARGIYEELQGIDAVHGLDVLFAKLGPMIRSESALPPQGYPAEQVQNSLRMRPTKGVVYRIKLTEKSGRYERRSESASAYAGRPEA